MDKKKVLKVLANPVLGVIIMSVVYMWAMPWGSFDPSEVGFYMAIFLALVLELSLIWFFKKFRKQE